MVIQIKPNAVMSQMIHARWREQCVSSLFLLLLCCWAFPADAAAQFDPEPPVATNISELRTAIQPQPGRICAYHLEGVILAVDVGSGGLIFRG